MKGQTFGPFGEVGQRFLGKSLNLGPWTDQSCHLGIGRQDVLVSGLTPLSEDIEIFGASSDHLVVNANKRRLHIGEEVSFHLNYGALLAAMTSPYVEKVYEGIGF